MSSIFIFCCPVGMIKFLRANMTQTFMAAPVRIKKSIILFGVFLIEKKRYAETKKV